ncbi:hypothetical protein LI328DRAFT_125674 [Trichoderma asperelloides]|nr:hypothetical protein LI328DRAFT_125674 [Trichoderma asperelloides]
MHAVYASQIQILLLFFLFFFFSIFSLSTPPYPGLASVTGWSLSQSCLCLSLTLVPSSSPQLRVKFWSNWLTDWQADSRSAFSSSVAERILSHIAFQMRRENGRTVMEGVYIFNTRACSL